MTAESKRLTEFQLQTGFYQHHSTDCRNLLFLVTLHSYPRFWEQHLFLFLLLDLFLHPQIMWFWWYHHSRYLLPGLRVGSWPWLAWPIRVLPSKLCILKWGKRRFLFPLDLQGWENMSPEPPTVCLPPWTGSLSAVEENKTKTEDRCVNEGLCVEMGRKWYYYYLRLWIFPSPH